MPVELTRLGKHNLTVMSPVMPAAGAIGFADEYSHLIKFDKLGAIVTSPITYKARRVARGNNVVPLAGGLLLHTGLPNPGVHKVLKQARKVWEGMPVPVIVHVMGTIPPDVRRCVRAVVKSPAVQGIELGIHDLASAEETRALIDTVTETTELPVLVRVPLDRALELAPVVAASQAGAIVVGAPPRGLARDPLSGQMLSGRLYGPLVRPQALRMVSQVVQLVAADDLPVIGCGGIHSAQDARDFIEIGARAVQLDSVIWTRPGLAEIIARDLAGLELTRPTDAYPDEWFPGIGETDRKESSPPRPSKLPD